MAHRIPGLLAVLAAVALAAPAVAGARAGDPDRSFGQRGTVTLKAADADAVGSAVDVQPDGSVLAGGSAGGRLVVLRLRRTGSLDGRFGTTGQVVPQLPGTSLDGVRSIAVFRDGRVVAAGTLDVPGVGSRMVVLRLLPGGDVDPSFGAGLGYVLAGPSGSTLTAMAMDRNGYIYLGGSRPGPPETPIVMRLGPDGAADVTYAAGSTLDGSALGLTGRVSSLLARPDGTVAFSVSAGGGDTVGAAIFTAVRLLPTGAPDPAFGGTGVVSIPIAAGSGPGAGAQAVHTGPSGSLLVAGTDVTEKGTLRGAVLRLRADGTLDAGFGDRGVTRIGRAGRNLRFTSLTTDSRNRLLLSGIARAPGGLVVRLRRDGGRDPSFGNGGLTYPRLGRPPGGDPVFTSMTGIDADGSRALIVGAAAGPGVLIRNAGGPTLYTGRFALTVSRLR